MDKLEIKSIIVLSDKGARIYSKHSPKTKTKITNKSQFEDQIYQKAFKNASLSEVEPFILNSEELLLHKRYDGLYICMLCDIDANEILMASIFAVLEKSLEALYKKPISLDSVLENLSILFLAINEIVFDGIISETEADLVVERVRMDASFQDNVFIEQTIGQAISNLKEQIFKM
ncbi:hypothetical protein MHBO_003030 [Bonamia ostreae]|uniref:Coatomer subunit zeta n=1 Tax=Bonamia ostreae TaxID=126728 RepID=A0ABV2AQ84_9EUKA